MAYHPQVGQAASIGLRIDEFKLCSILNERIQISIKNFSRSIVMWTHTQSVFFVGIVSIILALSGGPSCSLALESRRLLQNDQSSEQGGGRYKLTHWSNPHALHYTTGVSYVDRFKAGVQSGNQIFAALQVGAQSPSPYLSPSPAPSGSFESPVYSKLFEYAMEITIGTPPQTFVAIPDTTSNLVWLQCAGCEHCPNQTDAVFDPLKSSTFANMLCSDPFCLPVEDSCSTYNTCSYRHYYGSGESAGNKAYETVTLTSPTGTTTKSPNFAFGCSLLDTFVSLGSFDGIVGLGKGPLSFTTQLASLFGNKFSSCIASIYDSNRTSSLLFGDAAVPKVETYYTPMVQNPNASFPGTGTFYYINLMGIMVNGTLIDIPAGTFDINSDGTGGAILNSGAAVTYIATAAYTLFKKELSSLITYPISPSTSNATGLDLCYDLAGVENPILPNITIVLEVFDINLSFLDYFIGGPLFASLGSNTLYCSGFVDSGSTASTLGNILQQDSQILFDLDAQKFGFAPLLCDTL